MLALLLLLLSGPTPSPTTAAQIHALTYPNTDGGRFGGSVMLAVLPPLYASNDGGSYTLSYDGGASGGGSASSGAGVTTADIQLYVSTVGDDSGACTATGSGACLTVQGALRKLPKDLRHRAAITLEAGNFAGFVVAGFNGDPTFQYASYAGLTITGAMKTATVTPGTATGTATAGTAGTGATYGTLTDSGQAWTVNALRGNYLATLSGTGTGQTRPICSNTATAVTVCGTWTTPGSGTTYAIQTPATIITTPTPAVFTSPTTTVSAGMQFYGNATGLPVIVSTLAFEIGATNTVVVTGSQVVSFSLLSSTGTGVFNFANSSRATVTTISMPTTNVNLANFADVILTSSLIRNFSASGNARGGLVSVMAVQTGGAGFAAFSANSSATYSVSNVVCDCVSGGASCVSVGGGSAGASSISGGASISIASTLNVVNCVNAVDVGGAASFVFGASSQFTGSVTGYAVNAVQGGAIAMPVTAPTITAATGAVSIDNGAVTGAFPTSAYACVVSATGTGSRVCRQ